MRTQASKNRPAAKRAQRLLPQQRIAEVMTAARAVFCEKGYAATAIADIAAQLGIVEGTIFRYFPTKKDLLIGVVDAWYQEMLADYDRQLQGIGATRDRLRFMIWRHLRVIHDDPAMCRLVFEEIRSGPEYRRTAVYQLNREYTRRTLDIVARGIADGELRDVPLTLVRDLIYGGIEHRTWAYLRGESDFDPQQVADAIVDLVYRGLANSQAPAQDFAERLERATERLERLVRPAAVAQRGKR